MRNYRTWLLQHVLSLCHQSSASPSLQAQTSNRASTCDGSRVAVNSMSSCSGRRQQKAAATSGTTPCIWSRETATNLTSTTLATHGWTSQTLRWRRSTCSKLQPSTSTAPVHFPGQLLQHHPDQVRDVQLTLFNLIWWYYVENYKDHPCVKWLTKSRSLPSQNESDRSFVCVYR